MSYILATTGDIVRWYRFDIRSSMRPLPFELVEELDLSSVPQFGEKALARKGRCSSLGVKKLALRAPLIGKYLRQVQRFFQPHRE